jgi:DNA-binding NarL/FixJ family response regulator
MPTAESREQARILVVEDEAIIALDLAQRLKRLGYEVCGIADTSVEALAIADEAEPNLVLMDIIIQGPVDGIDAAAELVRLKSVPVVFLTAYADPATVARAKRVGPYGYLIKPFDELELDIAIQLACYRHRTGAAPRPPEQMAVIDPAATEVADGSDPGADAARPRRLSAREWELVRRHLPLSAGELQTLLGLVRAPLHGYALLREVESRSGGLIDLNTGAIYVLLRRMKKKGLIDEVPVPLRPGQGEHRKDKTDKNDSRRRYYRLTRLGRRTVRAETQRLLSVVADAKSMGALTDEKRRT